MKNDHKKVMIPNYKLELGIALIEAMNLMSQHHYDGVCKTWSAPTGKLATWLRVVSWNLEEGQNTFKTVLSSYELNTLMKICENTSVLTIEQSALAKEFCIEAYKLIRDNTVNIDVM